jgi:ferredoxin
MMEDGLSHVVADPVPEDQYDCAQEAAEICPVEAISVASV